MKFLLIISSVIFVQADTNCDGVVFNNMCHEKEVLKSDVNGLFNIAIDPELNSLYFSYLPDHRIAAKFNIVTKELEDIDGIKNGFSPSVNLKNHEVFIGSPRGIYKYYPDSNKVELYAANNTFVFHTVYFKDVLYYTDLRALKVYTITNGEPARYKDSMIYQVRKFTFDNEDNFFFTNKLGVFSQKANEDIIHYLFPGSPDIRELAVDTKGDVFVCHVDGIYIVNKVTLILEKVYDLKCNSMVFDRDNNVIYSDGDSSSLVMLKPKASEELLMSIMV